MVEHEGFGESNSGSVFKDLAEMMKQQMEMSKAALGSKDNGEQRYYAGHHFKFDIKHFARVESLGAVCRSTNYGWRMS